MKILPGILIPLFSLIDQFTQGLHVLFQISFTDIQAEHVQQHDAENYGKSGDHVGGGVWRVLLVGVIALYFLHWIETKEFEIIQ